MPEDNPARKSFEAGAKTAREAVDRGTAAAEQATRQAEQSYASISPAHGPSRRRRGIEKSNDWQRRLLRARRERPGDDRAAECDQQFPPSDGDCHTPLPCEVRKGNDTTPRACCPSARGAGGVS